MRYGDLEFEDPIFVWLRSGIIKLNKRDAALPQLDDPRAETMLRWDWWLYVRTISPNLP